MLPQLAVIPFFFSKRKENWIFIYKLVPFLIYGRASAHAACVQSVLSVFPDRKGCRAGCTAVPRGARATWLLCQNPRPLHVAPILGGVRVTCVSLHVCAHSLGRVGTSCWFSTVSPGGHRKLREGVGREHVCASLAMPSSSSSNCRRQPPGMSVAVCQPPPSTSLRAGGSGPQEAEPAGRPDASPRLQQETRGAVSLHHPLRSLPAAAVQEGMGGAGAAWDR